MNRTAVDADVGVGAALERMVDGAWVPTGRAVSLCLAEWQCTGSIGGSSAVVPLVGVRADRGGVGPLTLLRLDGLDPGRYRISQSISDGSTASAVMEVQSGPRDREFSAADIPGHRLEFSPAIVGRESEGRVRVRVVSEHGPDQGVRPPQGDVSVVVESLVAKGWGSPLEAEARQLGASELEVTLPDLPEGPHRVRLVAGDDVLDGYLWTVAGL